MVVRLSKIALVASVALFFSLVVFNNTTDFDSNYQFVRHVLMMDSTFPGNHGMWRAIHSALIHRLFYLSIIAWEMVICGVSWWATAKLARHSKAAPVAFRRAKSLAIVALTLGCLLWFVAFISVGGEWFLMWQSKAWNGQDAAFRMFTILAIILIYVVMPEPPLEGDV